MNTPATLPELPETISTPKVSWGYEENTLFTNVTLNINGEDRTATFWDDDEFGIISTAEDNYGTEDTTTWEDLEPAEDAAIHLWGRNVHARLLTVAPNEASMPAVESEAYAAILALITR